MKTRPTPLTAGPTQWVYSPNARWRLASGGACRLVPKRVRRLVLKRLRSSSSKVAPPSAAPEPGMSELEDGTRVSAEPSAHMHTGAQRPDWVTRETIERSEMKLRGG